MSFFQLARRETQGSLVKLGFMSVLGGASTAAILASVNAGAEAVEAGEVDLWSACFFIVALLLFITTQNYLLVVTTAESESIVHRVRVRILDKVRRSELSALDEIGRSEIIAAVTEDAAALTQAANSLVFLAQGVVLIVFVALYVAFLSIIAFVLCVGIIGVAGFVYHAKAQDRLDGMTESASWRRRFVGRMGDILDGFKEVRLNRARSDQLMDDLRDVSRQAANIKIFAQAESLKQLVFSQSAMYLLLGAIVFIVPTFSGPMPPGSITKNTMAVLFVVGACYGVMQTATIMAGADAAAQHLESLEERLSKAAMPFPDVSSEAPTGFARIEMRSVTFRYPDKGVEAGFEVGPLDFVLDAGELVFVTGGNGSGKSTFLKLLAGLYAPSSGAILLDGAAVDFASTDAYRALLTAVFTDSHLFDQLFGIAGEAQSDAGSLLRKFALDDKTSVVNGRFTTLDLSGGQSKRLALLVGLLERRQILLLDEWTANLDPDFRRRFYDEILPELKATGLTLVVITHDDFYLDRLRLPARRLRMDKGRFV